MQTRRGLMSMSTAVAVDDAHEKYGRSHIIIYETRHAKK